MTQQQWAKASTGLEPRYEENLTETSQYDRSEIIFPIIGSVALERDKNNRPILKPDSLRKGWVETVSDGEWDVTHAMHYIHQSMYYDINSKIEKLNAANKRHKKKHRHDDILTGDASQLANETFPVSPAPDKKDAPATVVPSIADIKQMKDAAAAASKAVFIQQVGHMDQSKPIGKKRALDQSEASVNVVQSLISRIARRRVVPWIGAGVTYNVYGGWEGVVKLLWEEAGEIETYEQCKQMEDLTVLASLAAIKLEQTGKDMWECMAKAFEQMEKRSEGSEEAGFTPMSKTLSLLQPIVCGPWPAMITTNWDSLLERAYTTPWYSGIDPRKIHMTDKADLDMAAKLNSAARREGFKIPRRYRKDVNLFYAEMKSGRRPPPLLKLHGDFTETGFKELVLSHADYRAIMVRDISMNELLRQIASEYSLLFLGTSLRDRDLLGILDEVSEGLGGGIGPHFWLTADELSPARVQHLHINYNTYTIYFDPKKYSFAERLKLVNGTLKDLCEFGWIAPTPIISEAAMTSLAIKREIDSAPFQKLTIPLKNIGLIRLLNWRMESHKLRGHAAASVAVVPKSNTVNQYQYGGVFGSQVLVELLKEDAKLLSQLENIRGTLGVDLPSWGGAKDSGITIDKRYRVWLLCGHQSNQGGVPSFVFKAVKDFLTKAFSSDNKDLIVNKKNKHTLRLSIPLVASGGGGMTSKQSFCATLSAVGYFFGKKFTGFPPGINFVEIDLYLAQENELSPDNVLNEISEGRIKPGTILSSSGKGVMSLRAIFISLKSHHIAKTVFVNFRSTFKELLVELGIIVKPNQVFAITIGSGVLAREFTLDTEKNKDMLLIDMGLAEESFIEIMDEKIKRKAKPKLSSATPNGK